MMKSDRTLLWYLVVSLGCLLPAGRLQAQTTKANVSAPAPKAPPLAEALRTPRETLKTLYYAVMAYDFRPQLIDEAIACLELDDGSSREPAEAARLAIELEGVLRELSVPLIAAPEIIRGDSAVLYDGDGCTISLRRQVDGLWRFDRATIRRIPAMYRICLARHRDLETQRKGLREGYTDASATMRRFLLDSLGGDFYAAAQALDLSRLDSDQRDDQGPILAQQLACVIQRRGWTYFQEIPNLPSAPPFTWHADRTGRIVLERIRQSDGSDAWLFSRQTVANLPRMYQQIQAGEPDPRWVRLGKVIPLVPPDLNPASLKKRPASVPRHLDSPRAVLKGFFRAMDEAEANDARLAEALDFLDLTNIPPAERKSARRKTRHATRSRVAKTGHRLIDGARRLERAAAVARPAAGVARRDRPPPRRVLAFQSGYDVPCAGAPRQIGRATKGGSRTEQPAGKRPRHDGHVPDGHQQPRSRTGGHLPRTGRSALGGAGGSRSRAGVQVEIRHRPYQSRLHSGGPRRAGRRPLHLLPRRRRPHRHRPQNRRAEKRPLAVHFRNRRADRADVPRFL